MALLDHGGQFSPPPPNAPRETTAAGSERALPEQVAQARAHEKELAPLAPKQLTREQVFALIGKYPEAVAGETIHPSLLPVAGAAEQLKQIVVATAGVKPVAQQPFVSKLRRVSRPAVADDVGRPTIVLTDAPAQEPFIATLVEMEQALPAQVEPQLPPAEPHQPAASNTDSPSRGIPTFASDPGKKITGGFGVPGEGPADYIPLDGVEVRQVVERLLDEIRARAQDDLRFSIACSYPRVSVRVDVTIEAHGYDKPIVIPRVAVPVNRTSLETARLHADEICFIVTAARREFDDAGESETPPNRMRMELGVEIPRKQRIKTPSGGSMWVDRVGENRG